MPVDKACPHPGCPSDKHRPSQSWLRAAIPGSRARLAEASVLPREASHMTVASEEGPAQVLGLSIAPDTEAPPKAPPTRQTWLSAFSCFVTSGPWAWLSEWGSKHLPRVVLLLCDGVGWGG